MRAEHACASEDLILIYVTKEAIRGSGVGDELLHQFAVEIRRRGLADDGGIVSGSIALSEDLLDLLLTHGVVAVGLPQVGVALITTGTSTQGQRRDAREQEDDTVHPRLVEVDLDGRDDGLPCLRSDARGHGRWVGHANRLEVIGLVETDDQCASVGHVSEGTQRLAHAGHTTNAQLNLNVRRVIPALPHARHQSSDVLGVDTHRRRLPLCSSLEKHFRV